MQLVKKLGPLSVMLALLFAVGCGESTATVNNGNNSDDK